MRVLLVLNDLRVGGAETLWKDLTPRLRAGGIDAQIFALSRCDSFVERQVLDAGVPVQFGPGPIHSRRQVGALADACRGFDVVHSQLFPAQLFVALAGRRLGEATALVTTEQNTYNRRRRLPLGRTLDGWMYRRYAAIVAISEGVADALGRWLPETRPRTLLIPNALAVARFADAAPLARAALGLPGDVPLLVSVGRLEPQKDMPTLLRALVRLPGVYLAIAGDGPQRRGLEALARTQGIADRVRFLGRTDQIPGLLKTADLYVQTSRWEGFGIAAAEAMAAGLPTLVSDVPGVREVIGEAGQTFPAGDDQTLAQRLQTLLADPSARRLLGRRGQERAWQFDLSLCTERHIALYRSVAGQGK